MSTTFDRFPGLKERWAYLRSRVVERRYARQLRALAKHIGDLAKQLHDQPDELARLLDQYAVLIHPWAQSVAATMVAEVAKRDAQGWFDAARQVGEGLKQALATPDLGAAYTAMRQEQVKLISSLPAEAADRVRKLTAEALVVGGRSSTLSKEIQQTGQVTRSRANLIARTETAKASSTLTMLRAQAVGSVAYIWRTAEDEDVRPTHKKMDGKLVMFDKPPIIDGRPVHAGMDFNCFPAETLVPRASGALCVFRAFYDGPLIVFNTGKTSFRVTPKHPILTSRGLLPAELVNVGDYLGQLRSHIIDSSEYDVDQWLTPIGDVFEAWLAGRDAECFVGVNLYGDAIDDQVEIVWAKEHLAVDNQTSFGQAFGDQMISLANGSVHRIGVMGRSNQVGQSRSSSFSNQPLVPLRGSIFGHQSVGIDPGPGVKTSALDYSSDCAWTGIENYGQARGALAFQVPADDLVFNFRVSKRLVQEFCGYVYTLQTDRGYYNITAAGVIVKNCRCYMEPIL